MYFGRAICFLSLFCWRAGAVPGRAPSEMAEKNNPSVCLPLTGKNGHLSPPGCMLVPYKRANVLQLSCFKASISCGGSADCE